MRIQKEGTTLHITLEPCCAIMFVEEHTLAVQQAFAEMPELSRVVVETDAVEEMDTAYLQLMVVTRAETMGRGAVFSPTGTAPAMREILDCYGISPTVKEKKPHRTHNA